MLSKSSSNSTPDMKVGTSKRNKKFQQDYQNESNIEVLHNFLIDSQIKETQNKQKLYQLKRENEALKDQLQELEEQKKKLEVAKDINQRFFKKNETEILSLKKPLDDQNYITDSIYTYESHESLRKKMKDIISEYRNEIDGLTDRIPDIQEVLKSDDPGLSRILDLLKAQASIYKEEMVQKEKSYRSMQDRYHGEFDMNNENHKTIRGKIQELSQDKRSDMLKKYALERKISYVEADVEFGNGYINAQKLALTAAEEINRKIQKADNTKSLNALSTKIQRKITSNKQN
ncbi:hypothetical protein SteCoe_4150 [Stentor coeruleus]|uniref:Uncharacterized protein n=1 Tax=Stentor coeruleus TaxID=5963 RepID=A0A1R2CVA4_9CILI|nr:hypothetical protein SteCoe_4150 [Stentor coeruleus]